MERPRINVECVNCGYCCRQGLCGYGAAAHGLVPGPCPSLVQINKRWLCQLFLDADEATRARMIADLGIGAGCSSSLCNTVRETQIATLQVEGEEAQQTS